MKIVVLAGGTSTERTVSITSGTGICKALRQKGHQAILVDIFCGIENADRELSLIHILQDLLCCSRTFFRHLWGLQFRIR